MSQITRKCRTKFSSRVGLPVPGMLKFIPKIRETRFIVDVPRRERASTMYIPENIEAVAESVRENPPTLTRHRFQELNFSRISLHRILRRDHDMTS